jgi:hypothetical protein
MVTQEDFVESCRSKYVWEHIPKGQIWHDAHYPTPECKGGTITVPLWESDHAAHNVIQSEELNYPCIFGWEINYLVEDYEYLVPIFYKWLKELRRIAGRSRGLKQSRTVKQENGRKMNQKMLARMTPEDILLRAQKGGQNGGQVTGRIRVQCPTCGMISTPGPVGVHLKSESNTCTGNPIRLT